MSDIANGKLQLDWGIHVQNRAKWTLDDLRPYAGQWVAWSIDGSSIVASDPDLEALAQKLEAMGIATDEVVHECQPTAEEYETLP